MYFFLMMAVGASFQPGAKALEIQFDCELIVETDFNKQVVLQEEESVVLTEPPRRRPASDEELDLGVEMFEGATRKISWQSMGYSYYLTPLSGRRYSGRMLVEMGVYRTNNFAPNGREVVFSSTREVGRGDSPLEVSFKHVALREVNVDLVCDPS